MTRYEIDSNARVAPATELDPEIDAAIAAVMRGRPPLILFTTLARDKRLFAKFFGGGLLDRGHLTLRQREIVIDRTTALNGAEYEWGVHVTTYGDAAGLSSKQIVSLTTGGADDPCWDAADAVLIRLADALHHDATVDDVLWEAVRRAPLGGGGPRAAAARRVLPHDELPGERAGAPARAGRGPVRRLRRLTSAQTSPVAVQAPASIVIGPSPYSSRSALTSPVRSIWLRLRT